MAVARPVAGSTSTSVPVSRTSPKATSKWVGIERERGLGDAIDAAAQNAVVWAGHADVALKRRAAGKDLLVGGGDVGVRAQHGADASVEIAAHQLHVAGRLGVKIDEHDFDLGRQLGQDAVDRGPGAIDRPHEDATQQADDGHRWPDRACTTVQGLSGSRSGEIGRLDDVRFAIRGPK